MEIQLNGNSLHAQGFGKRDGLPIIFIHAFPLSSEMWKPQVEAFSSEYRVITYDIRGFGQSGVGDGQYTIDLFAEDLLALQNHLDISKAVLVGLSMGGYIALRAKELHPDRVMGLVLADTRNEPDDDAAKVKRGQAVQAIKQKGLFTFAEGFVKNAFAPSTLSEKKDLVEHVQKVIVSNSPLGVSGALIAMAARTDTVKALTDAPTPPTLILVGDEDKLTPPDCSKGMQKKCPGSALAVLKGAGHLSNLENPVAFNAALSSFLKLLK